MAKAEDIPPIPIPTPEQSAPVVPPVEAAPVVPPAAPAPPAQGYAPATPSYPPAPPAYSPPPAYAAQPYAPQPPRGLSLASLICGIGGVVFSLFSFGFLPAIAAVITGHIAQRRQKYARSLWLPGLITGYVGVGISLLWGIFWVVVIILAIVDGANGGTGINSYSNS
ncbi:MAG: hypothetical protein JWN80_1894 [Microbacteriaceae bacterium]|jgi:hypothetical protein|nr:hypothetical protein [Microbacteriaceae bacterium]